MSVNDAPVTADQTRAGRPLVVAVAAAVIFLLGLVGVLAAILGGVGALLLQVDLPAFYALALLFWYTAGPCLLLAGYHLWKQKQWAAPLAAAIILLDVVAATVSGNVLSLAVDMLFLVLLGLAWIRLKP
jgi:hypothetical protein